MSDYHPVKLIAIANYIGKAPQNTFPQIHCIKQKLLILKCHNCISWVVEKAINEEQIPQALLCAVDFSVVKPSALQFVLCF